MTRIRVKVGQAEAEIDAEHEHLREAIDMLPDLVAKLPLSSPISPKETIEVVPSVIDQSRAEVTQVPMLALDRGDSLSDVIGKMFSDPWGRERRKLSDVREALQSYGLNYPKQSVAVALLRLAKASKIRRFKAEDGEFVYTAMGPMVPAIRQSLDEILTPQPN